MSMVRYLQYESNANTQDYGEVVQVLSPTSVSVNIEGAIDSSGNQILLKNVGIQGYYTPQIGDWVGINWVNGLPVIVGNSLSPTTNYTGNNVVITSPYQIASGSVTGQNIAAGTITAQNIAANTITGTQIAAGSITAENIDATNLQVDAANIKGTLTASQFSIKGTSVSNNSGNVTFAVDNNGNLTLLGNINMLGGSIQWGSVTPPTAQQVGALSASTKASDIGGIMNTQTAVFNTLTNNGTMQGLFMSGGALYINANYIKAGIISASLISGGILSGVTINVDKDITVGNNINLPVNTWNSAIQWSSMASISFDPIGKSISLTALGGVWAGDNQLDAPMTAKFG